MKHLYKDIPYTLTRSRRQTVSIYIERDGQVSVRVPEQLPLAQVEQVLEEKRVWIYEGLAEWAALNTPRVQREFVNGESFLYLGRAYRLKLVDEQAVPLRLYRGYFCLRRGPGGQAPAESRDLFVAFYRRQGQQRLVERVAFYRPQLGVQVAGVRVMALGHRWASCAPSGRLHFHWRVMMAPPTVIDYLVVHELAHLRQPNHSAAFWREVGQVLPDYRAREAWLREHGRRLTL